jgi:Glycosyl hydrolase 108
MIRKMRMLLPFLAFFTVLVSSAITPTPAHAADCGQALFGWTQKDGRHIAGTLSNEGVSKKNPRGFQASKHDRGNFDGDGHFCGGTAYGWSCKRLGKKYNVLTLTREQAIRLYHDNQWAEVLGDEFKGQYLAYKIFDVGVNIGEGSGALCLVDTVNEINGTATDFNRKPVVTHAMVAWINDFTRSDILPADHAARYPGDYGPGGHDSTRRKLLIAVFEKKVIEHYGNIIAKDPKMAQWWEVWKRRLDTDE